MGHIFISYSHKDKEYVHKLQEALQNEGFDVWIDDRIDFGTTWPVVIQRNLDACSAFIVVMSENAYESKWVHNEVTRAERKKKPFFILLLSGDTWLSFEAVQYEDVTGGRLPSRKFYDSLARVMSQKKDEPLPSSTPPTSDKQLTARDIVKGYYAKLPPVFRYIGAFISIGLILWGGSLIIPKLSPLMPTATTTPTLRTSPTIYFTLSPTQTEGAIAPGSTPAITFTPAVASLPVEITDDKGVQMMLVPSGEFTMGSGSGYDNERPVHTLYIDNFYIDKYEVTNTLYRACIDAGVCKLPMDIDHYNNSRYDNHPVVFVDWNMAGAYCSWRGGRLPTEAEWEKAARGADQRIYSWGNDFDPARANVFLSGLSDTNAVGMYENGKSPFGIYDLTGNAGEWTDSLHQPYPYNPDDGREDQLSTDERVIRGGSFENTDIDTRTTSRFAEDPSKYSRVVGFRCAKDATTVSSSETLAPALTPVLTNTPDAPASGFELVSIDKVAYIGGTASAQIRTQPGTQCTLTFFLPSGAMSSADGVGACTADQDGYCAWSWSIHGNVTPGTGTIIIIAGGQSESYAVKIE